jgi:hypothetical protein
MQVPYPLCIVKMKIILLCIRSDSRECLQELRVNSCLAITDLGIQVPVPVVNA